MCKVTKRQTGQGLASPPNMTKLAKLALQWLWVSTEYILYASDKMNKNVHTLNLQSLKQSTYPIPIETGPPIFTPQISNL